MCRQDPVCVALASKELLVEAKALGGEGGDATATKKRHRKAYEVCGQCNVEYDVEENEMRGKTQGLCKYHPGMCSAYTVRLEKPSIMFEIIFLVGRAGGYPRGVEFPSKSPHLPSPRLPFPCLSPRFVHVSTDMANILSLAGEKELESDADFWADHDENCHGEMDSLIDDPDFADGFVWTCCEMQGSAPPCRTTKHRPVVKGNKRAKWD
jgi:hypothetical protein